MTVYNHNHNSKLEEGLATTEDGEEGLATTEDDRTLESRARGTEPESLLAMASGGRGGGRGREVGTSRPKGLGWKLAGLELKKWYIPN